MTKIKIPTLKTNSREEDDIGVSNRPPDVDVQEMRPKNRKKPHFLGFQKSLGESLYFIISQNNFNQIFQKFFRFD